MNLIFENWKKFVSEGISDTGEHNMKYYAFDWDDNIVEMPTKIILLDDHGKEIPMGTEEFAHYRSKIGKEKFKYHGYDIENFAENAFRNFRVQGDKQFLKDAPNAKLGPSWNDFVECINSASIFAIITARGHTPNIMKKAVYNYIMSDFNGIEQGKVRENIKKYNKLFNKSGRDNSIKGYLDLCKFYPVSFKAEAEASPEKLKVEALREFVAYCKKLNNYAPIKMGFSDDDRKNIELIEKHFNDEEGLAQMVIKYTGKEPR